MALYFATRRSLVVIHNTLTDFEPGRPNEWKAKGSMNVRMRDGTGAPPRTCREEVVGIVGYGAVGEFSSLCTLKTHLSPEGGGGEGLGRASHPKRISLSLSLSHARDAITKDKLRDDNYGLQGKHIARLCTALGMKVRISSRKDATAASATPSSTSSSPAPARVPFTTLLATSSVLFLALPLSPATRSLLAGPELALVSPQTTIINVSRGGIVDEAAVLAALTAQRVFGYGTDVFATEPAGDGEESCLLGAARGQGATGRVNLVMTGHLAWLSETTIANQKRRVGENLRAWVEGAGEGDVVVRGSAVRNTDVQ